MYCMSQGMITIRSMWPQKLPSQLVRNSGSAPPVRTFSTMTSPMAAGGPPLSGSPPVNDAIVVPRQVCTWPKSAIASGRTAGPTRLHQSVNSVTASCGRPSIASFCPPITPMPRVASMSQAATPT